MFRNIGKQIKGIAIFLSVIEILAAIGGAAYMIYAGNELGLQNNESFLVAAGIVIAGILIAWLSNMLVYSYGQLVDSAERIARNTEILVKRSKDIY